MTTSRMAPPRTSGDDAAASAHAKTYRAGTESAPYRSRLRSFGVLFVAGSVAAFTGLDLLQWSTALAWFTATYCGLLAPAALVAAICALRPSWVNIHPRHSPAPQAENKFCTHRSITTTNPSGRTTP